MSKAIVGLALILICPKTLCRAEEMSQVPAWDSAGLAAFLDGTMEAQRRTHHFAGAVVVLVSGGRVAYQKGYGYADFAERKPVDPQRTLFRIASNSKMFVWTAVMQLVEEGKLDLQADVNRYLKGFEIPATFSKPVTLEHLMTHTAGFEDHVIGLFAKTPDTMLPLDEMMKSQMPRRVFPPGEVIAYSNYGTTLAALIVEQVSGIAYGRYLEDRILKPLGMVHATLEQPLPHNLEADMSKGYRWESGQLEEQGFEFVPWAPCGGMSLSGADMARFMMAQLNDGTLGNVRILRPETARLLRTRLSSPYSASAGMLHGFLPLDYNGQKIFGHSGDTIWFHSLTAMLPEQNMGVFVAYNTNTGSEGRDEFSSVFFDRCFPDPLPKETPPPGNQRRTLERFEGYYFPARSSFNDVARIAMLVRALSFTVDSDGYLVSVMGGEKNRWVQTDPLQFKEVDGKMRLVFRENSRGEILDVCSSPLCFAAMLKAEPLESPPFQYSFLAASLFFPICGVIGFPVAAVLQRGLFRPVLSRLARLTAWLTCAAWIAGFVAFIQVLRDPQQIVFGLTTATITALNIWAVAALLTALLLVFALLAWWRGWWHLAGRMWFALILLGSIGCAVWLNHWKLLGGNYLW